MTPSFYSRYSRITIIVAVFFLPLVVGGARRALLSNKNDVRDWLPARFEETQTYQWFQGHFEGEEFILASWEGCTLDDERLRLFHRKLEPPAEAAEDADPQDGPPEPDPRTRYFSEVITGRSVVEQLQAPPLNVPREEAIARLQGALIGPGGEQTCAVLTLSEEGKRNLRSAVGAVRSIAQECAVPPGSLRLGGPPVDNLAIDTEGERTLVRLAGLSAIVGLSLSWWCLRSIRLVMMVFSAALYAAALSMALVWYTGSHMNSILLTMPSLIYVLAISGSIHIINYYRDAIREGGIEGAPGRAIAHGWLPCTLAAGTTAVGLGSLYISDLVPIEAFGLYSAIGSVATLIILLWFLPAALELWPLPVDEASDVAAAQLAPTPMERHWDWTTLILFITRRKWLVTACCSALLAFGAYGLTRVETSVRLMKLFSPGATILQDYAWLEEHLGPLVPMEVVVRIDKDAPLDFLERLQLVRRVKEEIEAIPDAGGALSAATFAPDLSTTEPEATRPRSPVGRIGGALSRLIVRDRAAIEHDVRNRRLLAHRDEFVEGNYLSEENGAELWRVSIRVAALSDIDYSQYVHEIEAQVEPILAEARAEHDTEAIGAIYTGLVPLVYKAQRSLLDGLMNSFAMAFVMIAVLMMFVLRSPIAGLLSMVPNVFPAAVIFGMMGWLGIEVDIGSMMTASVALGVAVDDTLHYLTWFRRGIKQGQGLAGAVQISYERCAGAMLQTTLVGGLGLAVFAFSSFVPTQRFGYLMLALLTAALAGDLLFLPAILLGPLGRFFAGKKQVLSAEAELGIGPDANADEPQPSESAEGGSGVPSPQSRARRGIRT